MRTSFLILGSVFIAVAALFHIYFFTLESLSWREQRTWKRFGVPSQEHAEIISPMAFNQGFYNLFLALGAGIGLALLATHRTVGATLAIFASTCMVGSGIVLFSSAKKSRKAAMIQAGPPIVGIVLLIVGLSI